MNYTPSTDEERETELAMRNSINLAAYFRKTATVSRPEWLHYLKRLREKELLSGYGRRHANHQPIQPRPAA